MTQRLNSVKLGKAASLICTMLGALLIVLALVFRSEDFGSCIPQRFCDHTFAGTNIYIRPVVDLLVILSLVSFGIGTMAFLISRYHDQSSGPKGQLDLSSSRYAKKPALSGPYRRGNSPAYLWPISGTLERPC